MSDYAKVILVYGMPFTVRETAVYQALEAAIAGRTVSAEVTEALDKLVELYTAKATVEEIEAQETVIEYAWLRQHSN
jgi:hypothetical protein